MSNNSTHNSLESTENIVTETDIISITKDNLPRNVSFSMRILSRELEEICAIVFTKVSEYCKDKDFNFSLIVAKSMEIVESYKKISSKEKCNIATRCIIEIIKNQENIDENTKKDLYITIPGCIESIIQLTKGEMVNRNKNKKDVIDSLYVTKRSTERIIEYIRREDYDFSSILENIYLIITQTIYIVGGYPSLSGKDKKKIAVEVITYIIKEFQKTDIGKGIPEHYIQMVFDNMPSAIDTFISISNGVFSINNVKKCFSCCISCC